MAVTTPRSANSLSAILVALFLLLLATDMLSAGPPVKLGIAVFENLEGYHTQASELGTRLGRQLMESLETVYVEDSVPLKSNETVRILEGMTEDRKVVVTTLAAYANKGRVDYPTVVFADDAIKFSDLTWKIDEDKALATAQEKGLTHCLTGTCTGLVTPPNKDTAAGQRGLSAVTATINIRLHDLKSSETIWMNSYQKVVSHTDPRLGFMQAIDDIAPTIAQDINTHFAPETPKDQ